MINARVKPCVLALARLYGIASPERVTSHALMHQPTWPFHNPHGRNHQQFLIMVDKDKGPRHLSQALDGRR